MRARGALVRCTGARVFFATGLVGFFEPLSAAVGVLVGTTGFDGTLVGTDGAEVVGLTVPTNVGWLVPAAVGPGVTATGATDGATGVADGTTGAIDGKAVAAVALDVGDILGGCPITVDDGDAGVGDVVAPEVPAGVGWLVTGGLGEDVMATGAAEGATVASLDGARVVTTEGAKV